MFERTTKEEQVEVLKTIANETSMCLTHAPCPRMLPATATNWTD